VDGRPLIDDRDWSFYINIDHMLDLVRDVKNDAVELRVLILPPDDKGRGEFAMFRTINDFRLDLAGKSVFEPDGSFKCRVTRFMPSKV